MINECIIVGGGLSIRPEIEVLKPILATKFTCLTNYSYKFFNGTFLTFIDKDFYYPFDLNQNPDIYNELKQLPLIIGKQEKELDNYKLDNTILVKGRNAFVKGRELIDGFYTGCLTGVFSLHLVSFLMNYEKIIYLLGFDWNGMLEKNLNYSPKMDIQIHYYNKEEIKHRGQGYVGYYVNHNADAIFKLFVIPNLKIYNVSPKSGINCFEKIDYNKFYELLSKEEVNQEDLRKEIKGKIKF